MFNKFDVLETIDMIEREHLDIRTITMGVSLLPYIRETAESTAAAVYETVCRKAKDIVKVASQLSGEFGIPIVNKRVAVTPISLIGAPCGDFVPPQVATTGTSSIADVRSK